MIAALLVVASSKCVAEWFFAGGCRLKRGLVWLGYGRVVTNC